MRSNPILDRSRGAFTLIELLVVMAITAILLGLIFGPLVQGFNLTNRARVQAQAQETVRQAMELIQREIADCYLVQTYVDTKGQLNSTVFWVPGPSGNPQPVLVPYTMLDVQLPARESDLDPAATLDPTTMAPVDRGPLLVPLRPSEIRTRFWVGLRNNATVADSTYGGRPSVLYGNHFEQVSIPRDQHNPFVLYMARVSPWITVGGRRVVDTRLFRVDSNGAPIVSDPNFFYDNSAAVAPSGVSSSALPGWTDLNGDGAVNIAENWRAIAKPLVPTDKADLAMVIRESSKAPAYDPDTGDMLISSLVLFQPAYVGNDAGAPSVKRTSAVDTDPAFPTRYTHRFGSWPETSVRLYLHSGDLASGSARYTVYTPLEWVSGSLVPGTAKYVSGGSTTDTRFNPMLLNSSYAASVPGQGIPRVDLSQLNDSVPQLLFTFNSQDGTLDFAVSDLADWHDSTGAPVTNPGDVAPLEYDPAFVNSQKTDDVQALHYLSLLKLPNGDDARLFKLWNYDSSGAQRRNVVIVPGSLIVTGPDQRPGPHQGLKVTYTVLSRTDATETPGPNTCWVNYQPRKNSGSSPEPKAELGTILFDTTDMPTSWRDSDGESHPAAPITVTYQVQNNTYFDSSNALHYATVRADYITRELMSTALGVRLYDLNSGQPQQVTLTQKFRIRNTQR